MRTITISKGFSLIELLVVLAIVGILAVAGATYRMDRQGPAVKGALNAIHGSLAQAQKMARASGSRVVFQVTGEGQGLAMSYYCVDADGNRITNSPEEQYLHRADNNTSRYSLVETANAPSGAAGEALGSLQQELGGLTVMGAPIFPVSPTPSPGQTKVPDIWSNNLLAGTTSFDANGVASVSAFVVVVGTNSDGIRVADGPVGVILLSQPGSMFRYYRADSDSRWVRL